MSTENKKIPNTLHPAIMIAFGIVSVLVFVTVSVSFHSDNVYAIDVIASDLWKADGDMSITGKIDIMSQAYTALTPYTGNPQWPYATPFYDMDKTKVLLSNTADEALTLVALAQLDNFAYQQGIVNTNSHINDIAKRIDYYGGTIGWNPTINTLGWIAGIIMFTCPIWITVAWKATEIRQQHLYQEARNYN